MPSLGWKARTWEAKIRCCVCTRGIRAGMTHPNDLADPPARAMCFADHGLLMDHPDQFAAKYEPAAGPGYTGPTP